MEFSDEGLRELASQWVESARLPKLFKIYSDTTDYYRIDYDDVVLLGDRPYLVRNNEREGRFGIDEQQKFWVKRAIDLLDGSRKIIKLVFHERFKARVGPLVFDCTRSPAKETRVLQLTGTHPNFMHGFGVQDAVSNRVRVIDFVYGKKLSDLIAGMEMEHSVYFEEVFPGIFERYLDALEAICFLHSNGELHGDIRRDHIIIDRETGVFRWIDFDFIYHHHENRLGYDIFGLGNLLAFLVGKGDATVQELRRVRPDLFARIGKSDLNIIFHNRIMNLKKIFPHIPDRLNSVLMHFSAETEVFYDDTRQFYDDLREVMGSLTPS
ncbi:MAG TPA: hypothetical protein VFG09_14840 [Thermodesulfovibrionales bacterium]|nr:hypothetical protein [Thermodesulfovibrionales bacterium]